MRDDDTALTTLVLLVSLLLIPAAASAQDRPQVVAGFESSRPDFDGGRLLAERLYGWKATLVLPAHAGLGIVGQVDGAYGASVRLGVVTRPVGTMRPWFNAVGTGVRYTFMREARFTPFIEGLVGIVAARVPETSVDFTTTAASTNFEESGRAGLAAHLTRSFGVQVDAAYRGAKLFERRMHRVEAAASAVWWFK